MTETIKKGDFVEIEYTGATKDPEFIFDTTNEGIAKKNQIHNPQQSYGPVITCVGEHQIIPGLDKQLEGKEIGKEHNFKIMPEDGFGKKSAKLIQLVPATKFKKQNINPQPGLQVNIDGNMAIIKSVSGGRVLVDFNHPLSSKELYYKVKVNKIISDAKEKLMSYLTLGLKKEKKDLDIKIEDGKAEVKVDLELPQEIVDVIAKKVTELIPEIKELSIKKQ